MPLSSEVSSPDFLLPLMLSALLPPLMTPPSAFLLRASLPRYFAAGRRPHAAPLFALLRHAALFDAMLDAFQFDTRRMLPLPPLPPL